MTTILPALERYYIDEQSIHDATQLEIWWHDDNTPNIGMGDNAKPFLVTIRQESKYVTLTISQFQKISEIFEQIMKSERMNPEIIHHGHQATPGGFTKVDDVTKL